MKRKLIRNLSLVAALLAVCMLLTGCLLPGANSRPSIDAEDNTELELSERKLVMQKVSSVQVNLETVVGYFCFEDNPMRVLTPDSGDAAVSYTVRVYEGDKENGGTPVSEDKYTCSMGEDGYLRLNSQVIGSIEVDAECANGSKLSTTSVPIVGKTLSLWDFAIAAMAVYLLVAAVRGKGGLFDDQFVKEGMEQKYKVTVRITSLLVALLMIATVLISAFDHYDKLRIVKIVLFGLMLAVFIVCMILLRRCIDQEKKREAQDARYGGGSVSHSHEAAFVFDEDEPTVDDIGKGKNGSGE